MLNPAGITEKNGIDRRNPERRCDHAHRISHGGVPAAVLARESAHFRPVDIRLKL